MPDGANTETPVWLLLQKGRCTKYQGQKGFRLNDRKNQDQKKIETTKGERDRGTDCPESPRITQHLQNAGSLIPSQSYRVGQFPGPESIETCRSNSEVRVLAFPHPLDFIPGRWLPPEPTTSLLPPSLTFIGPSSPQWLGTQSASPGRPRSKH